MFRNALSRELSKPLYAPLDALYTGGQNTVQAILPFRRMRTICDIGSARYSSTQNQLLLDSLCLALQNVAREEWPVFCNKVFRAAVPHGKSEATVAAMSALCYNRARRQLARKPYMRTWTWDDWLTFYLGLVQNFSMSNSWATFRPEYRRLHPMVFSFGGRTPCAAGGFTETEQNAMFAFANRILTTNMVWTSTHAEFWLYSDDEARRRLNAMLREGAAAYAGIQGANAALARQMHQGLAEDAPFANFEPLLRGQARQNELPAVM